MVPITGFKYSPYLSFFSPLIFFVEIQPGTGNLELELYAYVE